MIGTTQLTDNFDHVLDNTPGCFHKNGLISHKEQVMCHNGYMMFLTFSNLPIQPRQQRPLTGFSSPSKLKFAYTSFSNH